MRGVTTRGKYKVMADREGKGLTERDGKGMTGMERERKSRQLFTSRIALTKSRLLFLASDAFTARKGARDNKMAGQGKGSTFGVKWVSNRVNTRVNRLAAGLGLVRGGHICVRETTGGSPWPAAGLGLAETSRAYDPLLSLDPTPNSRERSSAGEPSRAGEVINGGQQGTCIIVARQRRGLIMVYISGGGGVNKYMGRREGL